MHSYRSVICLQYCLITSGPTIAKPTSDTCDVINNIRLWSSFAKTSRALETRHRIVSLCVRWSFFFETAIAIANTYYYIDRTIGLLPLIRAYICIAKLTWSYDRYSRILTLDHSSTVYVVGFVERRPITRSSSSRTPLPSKETVKHNCTINWQL